MMMIGAHRNKHTVIIRLCPRAPTPSKTAERLSGEIKACRARNLLAAPHAGYLSLNLFAVTLTTAATSYVFQVNE